MKTIILSIITLFTSTFMLSNDITITINKNQKVIGTFSGDLNHKRGFQAFFTKNKETKSFEMMPILIDEKGDVTQLEKIIFKNRMYILSYHLNNEILSLLIKEERKGSGQTIKMLDINTKTQKHFIKELGRFNQYETIFRLKNKTFLFHKKKRKLFFTSISDSKNIIKKEIEIGKERNNIFKTFFTGDYFTAINSNEFVKNGSISDNTIYFKNDKIFFMNLNKKRKTTNVLRFDFNDLENYKTISIRNNAFEKVKDFNSYLYDGNIVTTISGKEDTMIKITNFDSKETSFKVSVMDDLGLILNVDNLQELIKKSSKSKYKPTVTANTSVDNNIVVNIDFVEKSKYVYYYNWNWMFQHQMMVQQQQQMIQNMNRNFGPNGLDIIMFPIVEKKRFMQFVISKDYKILKNASSKTIYKYIDTEAYMKKEEEDKSKKSLTSVFTDSNYYIIFFNKNSRKIIIKKQQYDL